MGPDVLARLGYSSRCFFFSLSNSFNLFSCCRIQYYSTRLSFSYVLRPNNITTKRPCGAGFLVCSLPRKLVGFCFYIYIFLLLSFSIFLSFIFFITILTLSSLYFSSLPLNFSVELYIYLWTPVILVNIDEKSKRKIK